MGHHSLTFALGIGCALLVFLLWQFIVVVASRWFTVRIVFLFTDSVLGVGLDVISR